MTSYEFQSMLYRTSDDMVAAIADAFLSADGNNPRSFIAEVLENETDDQLAEECAREWGLDQCDPYDYDDDPQSHMSKNDYTVHDLAEAFAEYRATFVRAEAELEEVEK